jgi:hypothetical protein
MTNSMQRNENYAEMNREISVYAKYVDACMMMVAKSNFDRTTFAF